MHVRSLLLAFAAAGLVLAGAAAPALASDNANVAHLYSNGSPGSFTNDTCGGAQNTSPSLDVGFVNYHLDGTTMTVIIHLKDATPDTTYFFDLWEGFCQAVHFANAGDPSTVKTDDQGTANVVSHFTVNNPAKGGTYWVFMDGFPAAGFVIANSIAVNP